MTAAERSLDSLKPYPAYKDSGVEWIGDIPEGWEVKRVKEVSAFKVGGTPPTGERQHFEGTLPWMTIADMGSDLKTGTKLQLTREAVRLYRIPLAPAGSLLMSFKLSVGKTCFAPYDLYTNEAIAIFQQTDSAELSYLRYTLPLAVIEHAGENIYGAKILNQRLIRGTPIPAPPKQTQLTIAAFLDYETARIDELVREQEHLVEDIRQKRQATIDAAVTGQLLQPNSPRATVADIGVLPSHWEVVKLKRIAQVRGGVTKGRDLQGKHVIDVAYLRVANVQDGYLNLGDVATIEIGADELERYSLKPGDVLMNEGGDNDKLGRGAVWRGEISPCVHQNHVFSVRPHGVDPDWLALVNTSSYAKFYFFCNSKQSTNLASISSSNIKELPVVLPPGDECQAILQEVRERLAQIDRLVLDVRENIEDMKLLRSTLITAATTGKIDVRDWRPA